MNPITEDQFLTLRNWAFAIKRRPGNSAKLFLSLEKGLTEEQIDKWWDDAMVQISRGPCQLKFSPILPAHLDTNDLNDSQGHQNLHLGSLLPAYEIPQVSQFSLTNNGGQLNPQEVEPAQAVHRVQRYSSANSSHSSYLSSIVPSTDRASSLLSVPSEDWERINGTNRWSGASYTSSSLTDNTSSSMFSFTELLAEEEGTGNCLPESIDPAKLTTNYHSLAESSTKLRQERRPTSLPTHDNQQKRSHIASLGSSTSEALPRSDKTSGCFTCTACQHPFSGKGEWKRHEGSQCEPQRLWICMLSDTAISTENGWICAFCSVLRPGPDRGGIDTHLEEEHKVSQCKSKSVAGRTFKRKDKLKDHLQRVHALSDNSEYWGAWNQNTAPQAKSAWGCGFCGAFLFTWEGRLEHIGEHYEKEHLDISQWSHSLTIKGLLRQPNIQQEWKDLVKSHGDNNLGWLREDAEDLKRKLEFGEGKPRSLALEALKLAKILDKDGIPSTTDSFWKSRAGRSSTLQDPNEAVDKEWSQKPAVPSLCLPGIAQVIESYSPWNLHLVDGMSRCSGDTTMIGPLPDVEMQDIISNYNV